MPSKGRPFLHRDIENPLGQRVNLLKKLKTLRLRAITFAKFMNKSCIYTIKSEPNSEKFLSHCKIIAYIYRLKKSIEKKTQKVDVSIRYQREVVLMRKQGSANSGQRTRRNALEGMDKFSRMIVDIGF